MPRTGWIQRGIPRSEAETVAEHTFQVTIILGIIAASAEAKTLDRERMILMGIIHDLGEAVSGDIPRSLAAKMGRDLKERIEMEIVEESAHGMELFSEIFREYLQKETLEAKVVKAADLIATRWQAEAYLSRGFDVGDILESCGSEARAIIDGIESEGLRRLLMDLLGPERS